MRALAVSVFIIGSVLLYFGSGMLLLMPGRPGERYFVSGRILYGVLPVIASAVLAYAAGWLWTRPAGGAGLRKSTIYSFALSCAAVFAIWMALLVFGSFRQG